MERIDLDEPRFEQAPTLQLVPRLEVRTLQNWAQRGLLTDSDEVEPGRGSPRLYTGFGIVALTWILALVDLGIAPSNAREMLNEIADHVFDLHASYPAKEEDGQLHWVIDGGNPQSYHRAYIWRGPDGFLVRIERGDQSGVFLPDAYLVVQLDFLCLAAFNRIYRLIAAETAEQKP